MNYCYRLLREYFEKNNREIPERVKEFLEKNEKSEEDNSPNSNTNDNGRQVASNDSSMESDDDQI